MVSADRVPFCLTGCLAGSLALDVKRVVPIPGLTGVPSDRFVLAIVNLDSASQFVRVMLRPSAPADVQALASSHPVP